MQFTFVTTKRYSNLNFGASSLSQPLFEKFFTLRFKRQDNNFWKTQNRSVVVESFNNQRCQPRTCHVFNFVDNETFTSNDPAFSDVENLYRSLEFVFGDSDYVEIFVAFSDHLLAFKSEFDRLKLIAILRCTLEILQPRAIGHLFFESRNDRITFTVHYLKKITDQIAIRLWRNRSDAWA